MTTGAQSLRNFLSIGLSLFTAGVLAVSGFTLWRLHSDAIENGLEVSAMQTRGFEDFLTESLHAAEMAAVNMRGLETNFADALWHTPYLRSISRVDASGRIVQSSNPANLGRSVQVESYLPLTKGRLEVFRVGAPWSGRDFADGRPSSASDPIASETQGFLPLMRSTLVDGRSVTLLMGFNTDYFLNHVAQGLEADEGRVQVLAYDGTLLMDTQVGTKIGTVNASALQALRLSEHELGAFAQNNAALGDVLTAYRASRLYPLVVLTHRQSAFALKSWRSEAQTLLLVVAAALLIIFFLAIAGFRRQLQLVQHEAEANRLRRINATVFDASSEAIIITDRHANIISVNTAFTLITGYSAAEAIGKNPRLLASGRQDAVFYAQMWAAVVHDGNWQGELVNRRKDGTLFDCHVSITASYDNAGGLQHFIGDIADISERKRAEHEIHELNRDFVAFLENTTDFVYFKDEHSRFRFCSQTLARITGHAHWRDMRGKHDLEVFPQETAQIYVEEELPIFHDGVPLINKIDPYRDADGSLGWVATSKWPVLDGAGLVIGLFGISRDITAAKKSEEQLTLAASVFANSREAIMITSTDSTIVDVNDAFTRITGYARGEVLGQTPHILASGRHDSDFYATLWRSLSEKGHWYGEVWNRRKNGEVYAEMQTISTVRDAQGVAQHFVSLFSDITTLKEHQLQLEHIAHFDALTNLPNRVLLADRMRQSMASTLRRGNLMAVAYLDLDGFKLINDQHGHEAGDKLLIALASHMREVLRDGDTLARIGGDEFVVVLVDLEDMQVCAPLLNRLLLAAAQTVTMDATDLQVSASVGVTFFQHGDEVDAEQLLRQADQAMYHAKLAGKNRYHVFNAEHDRSVRGHHENLENIRQAFRDSEFVLHYQPKVNMRTGQVIGAEALIRWQHPQHGLLYPAVFLPVFDEDPLAVEVGDWVIETALHQMEQWQAQGLAMAVSVNVGARQMQQPDFVERLRAALARHPSVQPQHFQIEILETSALEDVDQASAVIAQCGTLGVAFAMDDFGTGYSSLTYLKRLRVKVLKMDQSFVRDVRTNPDDTAILKSIVGLASAFQCSVIAEGVETTAHGSALLALGCDLAQGYGIARPMPADQLPAWASGWRPEPEWLVSP